MGQKRAERQVEAAERIVSLAYRLRWDFEALRSPMQTVGESERAERVLVESGEELGLAGTSRRSERIRGQTWLLRVRDLNPRWEELSALVPLAKAYFGEDVEGALFAFWQQRARILTAAQMIGEGGLEKSQRREFEADIWDGANNARGVDDPINTAIARAIATLEKRLLPVLREDPR